MLAATFETTVREFNRNNIDLLGALLHDSKLRIGDLPEKSDRGQVKFNVTRPYWEQPKQKRSLLGTTTKYKNVNSTVQVNSVAKVEINWRDDIYNSANDQHTILEIKNDKNSIEFITEWLDLKLLLDSEIEIKVFETNEPSEKFYTFDLGKIFDFEDWEKKYEKSKM